MFCQYPSSRAALLSCLLLMASVYEASSEDQEDSAEEETTEGSGSSETATDTAASGSGDYEYSYGEAATGQSKDEAKARKIWDSLPPYTRRLLAGEEMVKLEANKQFQKYLKALILEAKNMYQKNYLEFM